MKWKEFNQVKNEDEMHKNSTKLGPMDNKKSLRIFRDLISTRNPADLVQSRKNIHRFVVVTVAVNDRIHESSVLCAMYRSNPAAS